DDGDRAALRRPRPPRLFLATTMAATRAVCRFIERDVRDFLGCGQLERGFARLLCVRVRAVLGRYHRRAAGPRSSMLAAALASDGGSAAPLGLTRQKTLQAKRAERVAHGGDRPRRVQTATHVLVERAAGRGAEPLHCASKPQPSISLARSFA